MIHEFPPSALTDANGLIKLFAGALIAFASAVLAEPARLILTRPRLKLRFEQTEHFVALSHQVEAGVRRPGFYVRVGVHNTGARTAKACRVYLTDIEHLNVNEKWTATTYAESFQLRWVGLGEKGFDAYDLPGRTRRLCDLVSTTEHSQVFHLAIEQPLNRFSDMIQEKTTFRFTLRATGDGVKEDVLRLTFN